MLIPGQVGEGPRQAVRFLHARQRGYGLREAGRSVGQIVPVWVLELDKARRRVALTMIPPAERELQQRREEARKEQREQKKEQKSRQAE